MTALGTLQVKTLQLDQASGSVQLVGPTFPNPSTFVFTFPSIGAARIPTLQTAQLVPGWVPFADANGFLTGSNLFYYSSSLGLLNAGSATLTAGISVGVITGATTITGSGLITAGSAAINGTITGATTVGLDFANFTSQAASSTDGAVWSDSTEKTLTTRSVGLNLPIIGAMFVSTAAHAAITNAGPTTMFGTGVGTLTIPANYLIAGRSLRVDITGTISTAATSPTLNLFLNLGGSSVVTTGAKALTTSITTGDFHLIAILTSRGLGASQRVDGNIIFMHNNATATMSMVGAKGNANFNTSGSLALDVQCTTAGTGNTTVTPVMAIVTMMN